MLSHYSPQFLLAKNSGSILIPAHGLVEISGANYDATDPSAPALVLEVKRPTGDSLPNIAINGWMPIPENRTGLVIAHGPALVTTAAASSVGDAIGSETDSFEPAVNQSGLVMLNDMSDGKYLVKFGGSALLKHGCRFTAGAAFTTSDSTVTGTITDQYGLGSDHPSTAATFYNLLTHTAGVYEFYGDSGDAGVAYYMGVDDHWAIYNFECG